MRTIVSRWRKFLNTSYLQVILENFIKKNCIKQLCKNYLKTNYVKSRIHSEKDHLCFYKNSTNQTLTFTSSKVVYFRSFSEHMKYKTLRKESLHCHYMFRITTRQLSLQYEKTVDRPKRSLIQFTVNKQNIKNYLEINLWSKKEHFTKHLVVLKMF